MERRLGSARIFSRGFVLTLASLALATICGSVGLFLIIPRLSAQQMLAGFGTARQQSVSGFSEQVDFRSLSSIQLDPTIIGRVRLPLLATVEERPSYLRLRGTSLDTYTGRQWRKSAAAYSRQWPASLAEFYFAEETPRGERIVQEVILDPDGNSYLFGASMPIHYRFDRSINVVLDRISFSVQAPRAREQTIRYVVNSYLPPTIRDEPPSDRPLRDLVVRVTDAARHLPTDILNRAKSGHAAVNSTPTVIQDTNPGPTDPLFQSLLPSMRMPRPGRFVEERGGAPSRNRRNAPALSANLRRLFLQLPDLADLETVERLAREWTAETLAPLQQARIIERKLRTEYGYTTDIQINNPERHLTEFLTQRRQGHCEYFATAMTLMLRKLNIPARLVTGYYTDEWNSSGGYFLLRRQHAHSWVEAWMDPHGWVAFEPSPASGVGANRIPSALFRRVQQWLDTMRYLWYRHVIDFDIRDQFILARRMQQFRLTGGIHQFLTQIRIGGANLALRRMGLSPARILGLAILVLLAALLLWFLARELFRGRKPRRNGDRPTSRASLEQVQFYLELLRTLAALRYPRPHGQTPLEYAQRLVREHADWDEFLPITKSYYEIRYRHDEVPKELVDRARRLLERIRHAPRGGKAASIETGAA
jgi:transglutaminase-like putative cysteine protease